MLSLLALAAAVVAQPIPATQPAPDASPPVPAEDEGEIFPILRPDPHTIVVTATRSEQRQSQIGQAVTVLTQTDIDRRQLPLISDLLATTPGTANAKARSLRAPGTRIATSATKRATARRARAAVSARGRNADTTQPPAPP